MEGVIHLERATQRLLSFVRPEAGTRHFALLRKISALVVYHLLLRLLSAAGFFIALWLCPVQTFASLAVYLAAVTLAGLAVFGRYEMLIVGARDERQSAEAMHLCILTAAGIISIALLAGVIYSRAFGSPIALWFAGALFARAWLRLGLTFATRHDRYARALKVLLPHAVIQPFVLVALVRRGHDPLMAFVIADFVGHTIAAAGACISEWRAFWFAFRQRVDYRAVGALARAHYRLPTVNLTATASAFLFATSPLFFLPGLANGVLAGTLALLFRLLDVPTALTSSSMNPILMKEVADRARNGTQWMLRTTFMLPAIIAALVFGTISLGSLTLNSLHVIPAWHLALTLLPVVALFQASIAATSPLIDVATLAGRQQGLMAVNIAAVGSIVAVFLLCGHPVLAIVLAGFVGLARVIIISLWLVAPAEGRGFAMSPMAPARVRVT